MPTRIPLTQGKVAIVDDCDSDLLRFNWYYTKTRNGGYAVRHGPRPCRKRVSLHKIIAARKGLVGEIDHGDQNPLNNKRNNLRLATRSQNGANGRIRSDNKSGFRGVSKRKDTNVWRAEIQIHGRTKSLGSFPLTEAGKKAAARAYNKAAIKYFGKFAALNKVI